MYGAADVTQVQTSESVTDVSATIALQRSVSQLYRQLPRLVCFLDVALTTMCSKVACFASSHQLQHSELIRGDLSRVSAVRCPYDTVRSNIAFLKQKSSYNSQRCAAKNQGLKDKRPEKSGQTFLGLDFGTSGARAVCITGEGCFVAWLAALMAACAFATKCCVCMCRRTSDCAVRHPNCIPKWQYRSMDCYLAQVELLIMQNHSILVLTGTVHNCLFYQATQATCACRALDTLLQQIPREVRSHLAAIAIAATTTTSLLVNRQDGQVLTDPILYNQPQDQDIVSAAEVLPASKILFSRRAVSQRCTSNWLQL